MANSVVSETAKRVFSAETLRSAAKHSVGCFVVPVHLRRAIKKFIREHEDRHIKNKVIRLSQSLNEIKASNLLIAAAETSRDIAEDPQRRHTDGESSRRWKIRSSYGDSGLRYRDDETVAYVGSRMPAVFSACYRVLSEVHRRLPDFSPTTMVDFGAGTGSALWALRELWPESLQRVNIVEPSQSMQRAGQSLIQGLKNLPVIHSYDCNMTLFKKLKKSEMKHDIVIASYVLGEIPSGRDRITTVRQLWQLTKDVLVLIEPGTPQGSKIISQMRSHILWMEKRKLRKLKSEKSEECDDLVDQSPGAFIVAPCSHDGACPLDKTGTYCHFVQRLQRTNTQRQCKTSNGRPLCGYEDEKFSFVVIRRGKRPTDTWPLDGMTFETLKERNAKRKPEDLEADSEDLIEQQEQAFIPYDEPNQVSYDSDSSTDDDDDEISDDNDEIGDDVDEIYDDDDEKIGDDDEEINDDDVAKRADLGGGWGRIIFSPMRRGKQVIVNVCRSTKPDASEGTYEQIIMTKRKNPTLHRQARKSLWGDLWPN